MRRAAIVLPLLVLATACGSGSHDQKTGGPSRAAYLAKAEAVCTRANAEQKALKLPSDPSALPAYAQALVDMATRATKELEALTPPAADRAALQTKVLGPLEGQLAQGRAYVAELRKAEAAHDQAALGRLLASPPTGSKADLAWMRSYGFHACADAADTHG